MKRNLLIIIVTTLLTIAAFFAAVYYYPIALIADRNSLYVERVGFNQFIHDDIPDDTFRDFVKPSPDLIYSYLVYDISEKPLAIEIPAYDDYWLLQIAATNSDSQAYIGSRTEGKKATKFILHSASQTAFQAPEGFKKVQVQTEKGTFLLRYFVRSQDLVSKIDITRKQIKVYTLE